MTMQQRLLALFALGLACFCQATPFLNTYLLPEDKQSLKGVFTRAFAEQQQDISAIHHAVGGLKFLGESLSAQDSQKACEIAKKAKETDAKELYHATAIASDLPSCALSFPKAQATLAAVAADEKATSQTIYFALAAAEQLKVKVDQKAFDTALQNALKKDDSAFSLTYGLNAAVFLDAPTATKYFDRIEDLVGQADEVDGKYLQFEGGLSNTAGGVYAIYALSDKLNKSPAVKSDEAVKFANYLLNRKGVQMERAAFLLLRALKKLANNKYQVPVAFTLSSPVAVTPAAPKLIVKLGNVFGESVGALAVNIDSATHIASSGVVLTRKPLTKVANDATNTLYEFNFMEQPRDRGFYKLSMSAGSQDKRLVGTNGAEVSVKVLTDVSVEDVQVAVFDREHTQATNSHSVAAGTKLKATLEADTHQKLTVKFAVKEKQSKKAITVHQAFVAFVHEKTKKELIFVAEPDPATALYKFDVDLQKSAKDFDGLSGKYNIHLIVGDAVVSNAIDWQLADVTLKLPPAETKKVKKSELISYDKLPEIKHLFREPEKRPPQVVSDAFTAICLAPILLLLVLWLRVGINFGNLTPSLWTLGFHIGLAAIFGLYFVFWLNLNMFVTLKYLAGIGGVTFLCGNRMLQAMAERRKQKTE